MIGNNFLANLVRLSGYILELHFQCLWATRQRANAPLQGAGFTILFQHIVHTSIYLTVFRVRCLELLDEIAQPLVQVLNNTSNVA